MQSGSPLAEGNSCLESAIAPRARSQKGTQMMRLMVVMAAFLISNPLWAQARYDLLLKGGHVIDAKNQIDAVMDVAIAGGKIARSVQSHVWRAQIVR